MKNLELSGCLSAPGLAIGGGSKLTFKYANSVVAMVKGLLADVVTTADAPALTTAKNSLNATPGDLAIDYERAYTLLASINETTGALTFSLAASDDFAEGHVWKQTDFNYGNSQNNDSHKAVIGVVIIANTTNAFVPGTTALDASGVTVRYIDNVVPLFA